MPQPMATSDRVTGDFAQRLRDYAMLARLDRPIGALLLLWPTLWALWLAGDGQPSAKLVVVFVAGTFLMRGAGCAINDYADRDIDGHVKRTQQRPLASGRVSAREAVAVFVVLALLSFVLVLTTNWLTVALSFVGLAVAVIYPFMKRITNLPQAWLGICFSWGIPMAFAAQTGQVPTLAWLLLMANLLWVLAYDTIYAMVDRDDDIAIGVRSTAILLGDFDRAFVLGSQTLALVLLCVVWRFSDMNSWFWVGAIVAAVFTGYQYLLYRDRDRDGCFRAFLHNNWFGVAIFGGIVIGLLPTH